MNKQTKTDNACLSEKIELRKQAIKTLDKIKVLDLFAGENQIWNKIDKDEYYGIEKEKDKGQNVRGDNIKIIPKLDLSKFNVIDCDAYGFPIAQFEKIFENETLKSGTIVFYTAIHNERSSVNKTLLKYYNLQNIYKQVRTPINRQAKDMMYGWLYDKGIRKITKFIKKDGTYNKEYGYFIIP